MYIALIKLSLLKNVHIPLKFSAVIVSGDLSLKPYALARGHDEQALADDGTFHYEQAAIGGDSTSKPELFAEVMVDESELFWAWLEHPPMTMLPTLDNKRAHLAKS
jgi:hypothetical protein